MRVLAISWFMPPMLAPRSIQVSRLLAALSGLGYEITVISGSAEYQSLKDDSLGAEHLAKLQVERVPLIAHEIDHLLQGQFTPILERTIAQLEMKHFDILVTFAQPWVDHLIGLELKRKFNIPWVAHFSDPWVDSIYYDNVSEETLSKWREMEAEIIHLADRTIWTNQYALDLVMCKYPQKISQARALYHAYDHALIQKIRSAQKLNRFNFARSFKKSLNIPQKFRFVYIGNIYGKRSPEGLFQAVEMLSKKSHLRNRFEIFFIGGIAPEFHALAKNYHLTNYVRFFPSVSYLDSLKLALQADILLTIDAPHPNCNPFLPSKLIDYIGLGLPILGITQPNGASANILHQMRYPTAHPDHPAEIADALEGMMSSLNKDQNTSDVQLENLQKSFEMNNIGRQMDQYLREVLTK